MSWGQLDDKEFIAFANKINSAANNGTFKRSVEHSLASSGKLLVHEIWQRTPVDHGALRSAWRPTRINYNGTAFLLTITNNMEYASFVENGHRQTPGRYVPAIGKQLKASWVDGSFMMRDGVNASRKAIEAKLTADLNRQIMKLFE